MATTNLHALDMKVGDRIVACTLSTNGLGTYIWDVEKGDVLVTDNITVPGNAGKSIWTQEGEKIYTGP